MPVNVPRFRENTQPVNLVALISKEAAQTIQNGFSYGLNAGVAVLYAPALPAAEDKLVSLSFMEDTPDANRFAHPLCQTYRDHPDHDKRCKDWDRKIAMRYYDGTWKEPRLYQCHLGVWDISFPLIIEGVLLGVLFSGQMVVNDGPHAWREVLGPISDSVDWESVDEREGHHAKAIVGRLVGRAEPCTHSKLIELAERDERNIGLDRLLHRYDDFLRFGQMLTALLRDLYELRWTTEEHLLLSEMAAELITQTASEEEWWQALATVCSQFSDAAALGPIEVYCREDVGYAQRIGRGMLVARDGAKWIAAHVSTALPENKVVALAEMSDGKTFNKYARVAADSLLYRSELAVLDNRRISMIFVVPGMNGPDRRRRFIESFFRAISLRADIGEVLFRISRDQVEFADRVRQVSHQTKTPLQSAYNAIELAEEDLPAEADAQHAREYLSNAKKAIMRAKTTISGIYNGVAHRRSVNDLGPILREIRNELLPQATVKRCAISMEEVAYPLSCQMCVGEITTALVCLLDNAVKYSYDDHEIRIVARRYTDSSIRIQISNFGVGIPPETMEQVRDFGHRAKVEDPGRKREGWGVGLPVAIRLIKAHGGSLDIESAPADTGERMDYHRYVTTVTVLLPVISSNLI